MNGTRPGGSTRSRVTRQSIPKSDHSSSGAFYPSNVSCTALGLPCFPSLPRVHVTSLVSDTICRRRHFAYSFSYVYRRKDGAPMLLAGLYDKWRCPSSGQHPFHFLPPSISSHKRSELRAHCRSRIAGYNHQSRRQGRAALLHRHHHGREPRFGAPSPWLHDVGTYYST
jgi:hypothetical protein